MFVLCGSNIRMNYIIITVHSDDFESLKFSLLYPFNTITMRCLRAYLESMYNLIKDKVNCTVILYVAGIYRTFHSSCQDHKCLNLKQNSGCSSDWLERCVRDAEAAGSSPATPTSNFRDLEAGLFSLNPQCQ